MLVPRPSSWHKADEGERISLVKVKSAVLSMFYQTVLSLETVSTPPPPAPCRLYTGTLHPAPLYHLTGIDPQPPCWFLSALVFLFSSLTCYFGLSGEALWGFIGKGQYEGGGVKALSHIVNLVFPIYSLLTSNTMPKLYILRSSLYFPMVSNLTLSGLVNDMPFSEHYFFK